VDLRQKAGCKAHETSTSSIRPSVFNSIFN
jgi:hypothetical protein